MARDVLLIRIMNEEGIVDPAAVLHGTRQTGTELSANCAMLLMEASGGRNVFGHDPTSAIPDRWKGARVTHWRYRYYRSRRRRHGCQGVGPCQLTSADLQHAADVRGGCWVPAHNMAVGFSELGRLIAIMNSAEVGAASYNGSGPAAVAYGRRFRLIHDHLHRRFQEVR